MHAIHAKDQIKLQNLQDVDLEQGFDEKTIYTVDHVNGDEPYVVLDVYNDIGGYFTPSQYNVIKATDSTKLAKMINKIDSELNDRIVKTVTLDMQFEQNAVSKEDYETGTNQYSREITLLKSVLTVIEA